MSFVSIEFKSVSYFADNTLELDPGTELSNLNSQSFCSNEAHLLVSLTLLISAIAKRKRHIHEAKGPGNLPVFILGHLKTSASHPTYCYLGLW